jgi:gamma-glutamyltranspeptidase/glutathione hydrolase
MDDRGGVVSLTTTINALFGCKFVAPGTGILLNNQMDDFDTQPGKPNMYGLVGRGVNAAAPGSRMLSSMSPTIVVKNGEPWLALGSRGGPRILSSIIQVVLNRCVDGMDLVDAVKAPRIHHQWWPDEVFFEDADELAGLRAALEAMGYQTVTKHPIGRVIAAERLDDGRYLGVRDPRISGLAMPVEPVTAE